MTTLIQILGRVENDLVIIQQLCTKLNAQYELYRESQEAPAFPVDPWFPDVVKTASQLNRAIESYFNSSRVLGDTSEKHQTQEATFNCPPGGKPMDFVPPTCAGPWDNISTMGMDRTNHGSPI